MARPKADSTGKLDTHIAQASESGSTNGPLSQDDWEWFKPLDKEV